MLKRSLIKIGFALIVLTLANFTADLIVTTAFSAQQVPPRCLQICVYGNGQYKDGCVSNETNNWCPGCGTNDEC